MNGKVKWVMVAVVVIVLAGAAISIFSGRGKTARPTGAGENSSALADTSGVEISGTWDGKNLCDLIAVESVRKIMGIRGDIQVNSPETDGNDRNCAYITTEGKMVIVTVSTNEHRQFPETNVKAYAVAGTQVFWISSPGRLAAFDKGAWSVGITAVGVKDDLAVCLKLAEVAIRRIE